MIGCGPGPGTNRQFRESSTAATTSGSRLSFLRQWSPDRRGWRGETSRPGVVGTTSPPPPLAESSRGHPHPPLGAAQGCRRLLPPGPNGPHGPKAAALQEMTSAPRGTSRQLVQLLAGAKCPARLARRGCALPWGAGRPSPSRSGSRAKKQKALLLCRSHSFLGLIAPPRDAAEKRAFV